MSPLKNCDALDNHFEALKVSLRKRFLPSKARVLDLFCGEGILYQNVYEGVVEKYFGVDKEKIHDSELCALSDNVSYLLGMSVVELSDYNVFDLDAYGCPWKLFYLLLERHSGPELTVFMTDGLKTNLFGSFAGTGELCDMVLALEGILRKFEVPCMGRWYEEMFLTMLLTAEERYGWSVATAKHISATKGVSYWYISLKKT